MIECNFSSISGARVRQTSQVAGHSASCTCSIPGHTVALSWILDDPWIAAKKTNLDQGYLDRFQRSDFFLPYNFVSNFTSNSNISLPDSM